jgi:hypothetical protein
MDLTNLSGLLIISIIAIIKQNKLAKKKEKDS